MLSLLLLILTICVSAIVVRVGSIALELTGIPEPKAYFQALTAYTGVGYTTRESDQILANPQRRKVITWLMRLGSAGVITAIATLAGTVLSSRSIVSSLLGSNASFVGMPVNPAQLILLLLVVVLGLFYLSLRQPGVSRFAKEIISVILLRERFVVPVEFEEVALTGNGYGVLRTELWKGNPLIGKSLLDSRFSEQDIEVLSVEKQTGSILQPDLSLVLEENDALLLFGPVAAMQIHCSQTLQEVKNVRRPDESDPLLDLGTRAPEFQLLDQRGEEFRLAELDRKRRILYFYPKDKSYFCSQALAAYGRVAQEVGLDRVEVIGVNPAKMKSHREFCSSLGEGVRLLSDPGRKVARRYMAVTLFGLVTDRTTYVLDEDNVILYAARGRPPLREVMAALGGTPSEECRNSRV